MKKIITFCHFERREKSPRVQRFLTRRHACRRESVSKNLVCQSEPVEDCMFNKNSHFDKLSVTAKLILQYSRIRKLIRNDNRIFPFLSENLIKDSVLFFAIFFSLVIYSCGSDNNNSDETTATGTPVTITHPAIMDLKDYLKLNANTIFLNKEIVRASFQGYIEKIYKNIGDEVNPGDVLFQVKTKESAAADSTQINIGTKIFTGSVLIKAKTKGVLTELNYHNGDLISDGEQIAVVSNPSSLRIRLNVPFEDAQKIKLRQNCVINLPDGEKLNGVIDKSVPSVDAVSQTQAFLIKLLTYRELPENLNVFVMIPFRTFKNAIVLPKSSVMTNVTEDAFWIMKLVNDTTAIRIDVNRGIETDSLQQILSPKLNLSDIIISSGSYGLPDTAKVEIVR